MAAQGPNLSGSSSASTHSYAGLLAVPQENVWILVQLRYERRGDRLPEGGFQINLACISLTASSVPYFLRGKNVAISL